MLWTPDLHYGLWKVQRTVGESGQRAARHGVYSLSSWPVATSQGCTVLLLELRRLAFQ